ncbi:MULTISPECIES: hypothetical protein [unclassified Crossiella]|uniref:hypothetical protein n=1 Tax=unclassified Crossiella TaxID=2620835 RepID=UPI001FFE3CD7|nr:MULTISPECIES: hypothetical protein [unclassified Crossiella]MCK2243390.1 hypothetical protein [Crossiella sp. S99.2]MCK2254141.1 hypothetical protein [Crossiella sp. S99.1]
MDENLNGYVAFLVLGVILVLVDGQLILRSGKAYLQQGYRDQEAAASMARLVAVLFHLVVLGLFMIISTMEVQVGGMVQTVITKLGIVLLLLGLMHGVTMAILNRIRARQREQVMADEMNERIEERHAQQNSGQTYPPVPAQGQATVTPGTSPSPGPVVSPAIEDQPGVARR